MKIVGEGPLRSIRVRNFAGIGLDYRVNVETYISTFLGKASGDKGWKYLFLKEKEDAVILLSTLDEYREQEVNVNLTYNGRLVAHVRFILKPEDSPFWEGFWEGFKSQWFKIVLTGVVMVVINVATGGTVGTLALKLTVLAILSAVIVINAASQYMEFGQIIFASRTLNEFRSIIGDYARDFEALGYHGTASFFKRAFYDVQQLTEALGADLVSIIDFISRVCTDMTLEEWAVLLGLKDAEPYSKGFLWGKAVGNAISLIEFLTGFCHLAAGGATPASLGAKAKAVLQGVWNWLTPSLTDAISVIRNTPRLAKGFSTLLTIFSNARELGKSIVEVLKMDTQAAMDFSDLYGRISEKMLDAARRKKLGDDPAQGVLELSSRATKLGEEAQEKLGRSIDTILSKSEGFAGEFFKWVRRAGADPKWIVETAARLSELDSGELDDLGRALSKVGDSSENGVKFFETYFWLEEYYLKQLQLGEERVGGIKYYFLDQVREFGVKALEAWSDTLEYSKEYRKLGVPLRIIEYGEYVYPCLSKGLAEKLEFKEGDVLTLFLKEKGKEYRALAHAGAIDGTITVYPQKIEGNGALMGTFGIKAGNYIAALKGAVEPDFFFSTAKEIGENVMLVSESRYFGEFLSYNNPGICIIEYEKIGSEPRYKVWDSNQRTVTLKSCG
ncbi:MAG: hypothetical protein ACP5PQ_05615 [Thermoproteota archaeon]